MAKDCCAKTCEAPAPAPAPEPEPAGVTDAGDSRDCADVKAMGMCGKKINFGSCVGDLVMAKDCCAKTCDAPAPAPEPAGVSDAGDSRDCADVKAMGMCDKKI